MQKIYSESYNTGRYKHPIVLSAILYVQIVLNIPRTLYLLCFRTKRDQRRYNYPYYL